MMLECHELLLRKARIRTTKGDYGAAKYYVLFANFSASSLFSDVDARREARELEILIEDCIEEEFRVIADERGLNVTEANRQLLIEEHSPSHLRYLELLRKRQPGLYAILSMAQTQR